MKKRILVLLILSLIMAAGCGNKDSNNTDNTRAIEEVENEIGVRPYNLSDENMDLLKVLNLEEKANILSFKAPRTTKNIKANICILEEGRTWKVIDRLSMKIEDKHFYYNDDVLKGTFSMIISDVNTKEMNINIGPSILSLMRDRGEYRMYSDMYKGNFVSSSIFLEDFKKIELNKEIPVAIMVKNIGGEISSYNINSFFDTAKFEDMDYVEAVTLIFED